MDPTETLASGRSAIATSMKYDRYRELKREIDEATLDVECAKQNLCKKVLRLDSLLEKAGLLPPLDRGVSKPG